jgi:hypothetical protein
LPERLWSSFLQSNRKMQDRKIEAPFFCPAFFCLIVAGGRNKK